VKKLNDNDG